MPIIGEIKLGRDIGYKRDMKFIWSACDICKKERWVHYVKGKAETTKCVACCKIGKKIVYHAYSDNNAIIGDIKTPKELGFVGHSKNKYIYAACINCGTLRWVQLKTVDKYKKCRKCMHKGKIKELNGTWKGGIKVNYAGYIMVRLYPDNPYYSMCNNSGYVFEHRLVMAQQLDRCLKDWEEVHHRDSIKTHNIPENLFVTDAKNHNKLVEQVLKYQETEIKELKSRVTLLEAENELLKVQGLK